MATRKDYAAKATAARRNKQSATTKPPPRRRPPAVSSASATRNRPQSRQLPGWLWLLGGLLIGGFATFLTYISGQSESPPVTKAKPPQIVPQESESRGEGSAPLSLPQPKPTQPAPEKKPPEPKPEPEPVKALQYDFYHVLPEREVIIPEQELRREVDKKRHVSNYLLQVASFKQREDAEAAAVNLLLLNFQPQVEEVSTEKGTWHRIRVGPFDERRKLDRAKRLLQENGFEPIIVRGR